MVARRKNKQGLTDVQLRILEVIESFWKNNGYAPSVRGIQDKAGISSTSMVKYYLAQLEKLDLIERDERLSRTVRLKKPLDEILGLHPAAALESIKEAGRSIQDVMRELEEGLMALVKLWRHLPADVETSEDAGDRAYPGRPR